MSLTCEISSTKERYTARETIAASLCAWCQSRKTEMQLGAESGYQATVELPCSTPGSGTCGACRIFHWATSWLSEGDRAENDYFILDLDVSESCFSISQYRGESRCWKRDAPLREMHLFRTDSCRSLRPVS